MNPTLTTQEGVQGIQSGNQWTNLAYASPELKTAAGIPTTTTPSTTAPITTQTLKPQADLTLPATPIPTTTAGTAGYMESYLKTEQAKQQQMADESAKNVTASAGSLEDTMRQMLELPNEQLRLEQESGLDKKAQRVTDFTNQLEAEQHALQRQQEAIFGNGGVTREQAQQQFSEVQRQSLSKQADLALLQSAANRDLETAQSIIDRKIKLKLEPLKMKLDFDKFFYSENKEVFNKQEQRAFELRIKQQDNALKMAESEEGKIHQMWMEAVKAGAPASVQKAILASGDSKNAMKLAGPYLGPKAAAAGAPTIKTINGVDMQWNPKTGKWETPNTDGATSKPGASIDQIKFLRNTVKEATDLSGASGASGLSKTLGAFFVGDTEAKRLAAKTNTLRVNILALQTDPNIKKFFGPQMSNADVELMTSAGTTLNPDNNSPEDMRNELIRLDDLLNRMETAVTYGLQGATIQTAPDGTQVIITD